MLGHLLAYVPPRMERGLAWFPYVIFKGAIHFKFNQGGLLLERKNVNNPGDDLALDCAGISKFLFRVERKAPCLRMQTEPSQGWGRRGSFSRAAGLKGEGYSATGTQEVKTVLGPEKI